jgi:hypothetical protein
MFCNLILAQPHLLTYISILDYFNYLNFLKSLVLPNFPCFKYILFDGLSLVLHQTSFYNFNFTKQNLRNKIFQFLY